MHGLGGQQDGEVGHKAPIGAGGALGESLIGHSTTCLGAQCRSNPRLQSRSPKNGHISRNYRRLSTIPPRNQLDWESGDDRITKARHWRPFRNGPAPIPRSPCCLAGDAVLIAPVSRQIPC
jgi:hypothetical protein